MESTNFPFISSKEELFALINSYDAMSLPKIEDAFAYAEKMHEGQYRKSGEPYIIHPLNVAYEVAKMQADADTVCAALLHDAIEDTKATYADILHLFGPVVANLVEGVTNLTNISNASKAEIDMANYRKIIRGFEKDGRIIIIKLADRLHNMRTLEYKSPEKRRKKAQETLTYYAPLALHLGAHSIKDELEDLSLKYLYPEDFNKLTEKREEISLANHEMMSQMLSEISSILSLNHIPSHILIRIKHVYGIYREMQKGHSLYDIHDLLALKVLVDEVNSCYAALGLIHSKYIPVNEKFKDFIANPKTNHYKAVHTTVFAPNGSLLQFRIKTYEMDYTDRGGILSYWYTQKLKAPDILINDLDKSYPFLKTIRQMDEVYTLDSEFMEHIKDEVFGETVYIHLKSGRILSLPKGSTPIDVAYNVSKEVGDRACEALVNEKKVPFSYILQNNDRVQIILAPKDVSLNHEGYENYAKTTRARILSQKA